MQNEDEFKAGMQKIREQMQDYEKVREEVVKQARMIQREAKSAIFALQRDDKQKAQDLLTKNKDILSKLIKEHNHTPLMRTLNPAIEEYAEAQIFFIYLTQQRIATCEELGIPHNQYIGGLCDYTGEVVRYCYAESFKKNKEFIEDAKLVVDKIYEQLLECEFKGELRRKFDSVKYSIQKLEHLLFELNIAQTRR